MSAAREIALIKLGGSLITDKQQEATPRVDTLARLARELAAARQGSLYQPILGHGSGSFGHAAAARFGVGQGRKVHDLLGAAKTADQAARLHRMVVAALLEAEVPALGWAPSSAWLARGRRRSRPSFEPLLRGFLQGYLPVFYGDVVVDTRLGAAIVSTEAISLALAQAARRGGLPIRRAFWLGETDGIYDAEGRTIPQIDRSNFAEFRAELRRGAPRDLGKASGVDVTGGMELRLQTAWTLAHRGIESWIVDGRKPGLLQAALAGEAVGGTRVAVQ